MNPYNCLHYDYGISRGVCSYDGLYKVKSHVLSFLHNIVHCDPAKIMLISAASPHT